MKKVVCKGLCKNSEAYRWCHVPMTLWALRLFLQDRFSFCSASLRSTSLMLSALFSVHSKAMYSWPVFHCHCPCHSVYHRLWNLYSPCTDMPASQEWFQFNFKLGGLLHMVLFRHITFLVRMTYCFQFHFPVE